LGALSVSAKVMPVDCGSNSVLVLLFRRS